MMLRTERVTLNFNSDPTESKEGFHIIYEGLYKGRYREISNIRRTECQHLNFSRLVLQ